MNRLSEQINKQMGFANSMVFDALKSVQLDKTFLKFYASKKIICIGQKYELKMKVKTATKEGKLCFFAVPFINHLLSIYAKTTMLLIYVE